MGSLCDIHHILTLPQSVSPLGLVIPSLLTHQGKDFMVIDGLRTIGEVVSKDYRTASIFKKHGIDYCCGGNRTVEDACIAKGLNPESLINELSNVTTGKIKADLDYDNWPIDRLVEHIEGKHHRYVESAILSINPVLEKLTAVHGANHPELIGIRELFSDVASNMIQHLKKEELTLFPFLRKLAIATKEGMDIPNSGFGTIQNATTEMKAEHETEGYRFETINRLSHNYTPPADACSTYRIAYELLREFEEDLHLHIHLENNILFPKALKLECEQTTS